MFLNQINPPLVIGNVCDYVDYGICPKLCTHIECLEKDSRFIKQTESLIIYKAVSEDRSNESCFKFRRYIMFAIFTLIVGLVAGVVGMNHADSHHKNDGQQQEQKK